MSLPAPLQAVRESLLPIEGVERHEHAGRRAAVLILLYSRGGRATFALTQRPDTLSRHPGQISLPGGMAESQDPSLWHTAVRETEEELGLKSGRIVPLGRLHDVRTRVSDSVITPFVAWNPVVPRFHPDGREVSEILETPLDWLLDEESIQEEDWTLRGSLYRVAFFQFHKRAVWGITAIILDDFRSRLTPVSGPVRPGSVRPVV
jgi:8-oxo-dGTP pyrophosphatase MutT (NUDIX family)